MEIIERRRLGLFNVMAFVCVHSHHSLRLHADYSVHTHWRSRTLYLLKVHIWQTSYYVFHQLWLGSASTYGQNPRKIWTEREDRCVVSFVCKYSNTESMLTVDGPIPFNPNTLSIYLVFFFIRVLSAMLEIVLLAYSTEVIFLSILDTNVRERDYFLDRSIETYENETTID